MNQPLDVIDFTYSAPTGWVEYEKIQKGDELAIRLKREDSPRRPPSTGPELTLHVYQYFEEQVTDEEQLLRVIRRNLKRTGSRILREVRKPRPYGVSYEFLTKDFRSNSFFICHVVRGNLFVVAVTARNTEILNQYIDDAVRFSYMRFTRT